MSLRYEGKPICPGSARRHLPGGQQPRRGHRRRPPILRRPSSRAAPGPADHPCRTTRVGARRRRPCRSRRPHLCSQPRARGATPVAAPAIRPPRAPAVKTHAPLDALEKASPQHVITQHSATVTISGAPLLAATYRAVLLGIRARRADGLPFGDLQELARALYRAHTSPERHNLDAGIETPPSCDHQQSRDDWCTTGEAASLLGLSRRSVQRMARDPGGLDVIRVGRTYMFRSAPLLVLAAERRARHDHPRRLVSGQLEAI